MLKIHSRVTEFFLVKLSEHLMHDHSVHPLQHPNYSIELYKLHPGCEMKCLIWCQHISSMSFLSPITNHESNGFVMLRKYWCVLHCSRNQWSSYQSEIMYFIVWIAANKIKVPLTIKPMTTHKNYLVQHIAATLSPADQRWDYFEWTLILFNSATPWMNIMKTSLIVPTGRMIWHLDFLFHERLHRRSVIV